MDTYLCLLGPKKYGTKYPIKIIMRTSFGLTEMPSKCVECDHLLVGDEVEYLYKGKSYCEDCYRAAKKAETGNST
jgi:hypothetical protein